MSQKKILLISVSAGSGHTRAAEAIQSWSERQQGCITTRHLDAMQYVSGWMRKLYVNFYILLLTHAPSFWGQVYWRTHHANPDGLMHKVRRWFEKISSRQLLQEIEAYRPDAIVCTHFLPAELLSRHIAAGRLHVPVWVQITDYDLHRMWVHDGMAGYFAPNDEVALRMRHCGINAPAIHITGIPIMAAFSQRLDRAECARALGIDPQKPIVLLMGGGAGIGSLEEVARHLLGMHTEIQIVALAGKNAALLQRLQQLAANHPGKLVPLGFTQHVENLMACADFAITKPGGLTTSECLAMGLPMIVNAPIPGQEEQNANFLLEHGAALKACDLSTLEYRIRHLLAHPDKLQDMRAKARALGKPDAARQLLDILVTRIPSSHANA